MDFGLIFGEKLWPQRAQLWDTVAALEATRTAASEDTDGGAVKVVGEVLQTYLFMAAL